ncbi:hypothetical protein DBO86_25545 [Pseudomonas indoloxydans]|uniref:Uncharacterized protein n=1 Tax=Ectopseudomonas oleovorans TaxID=301 RepID=A0A2T5PCZ5_ECTOL|nr:hypothetical protein [Pseudomonas indoloxydans]PTU75605.1 hypothetical protein DBO86_25545 [Pseudomonas indoloxydans]
MSRNPPKDSFACLMRLRAELQQCQPDEVEQRRGHMLAMLDNVIEERIQQNKGRSETIQMLSDAFLGGVTWGQVTSEGELSAEAFGRHAELLKEVTGLDAVSLLWLFYQLESKAVDWIKALSALAQTTKPSRVKEQCGWLPDGLIHNADKALKAEKRKAGDTMTNKGKGTVRQAWISAGLHQRRAKRGELASFCEEMAQKHNCLADTIQRNWVPAWRKELASA